MALVAFAGETVATNAARRLVISVSSHEKTPPGNYLVCTGVVRSGCLRTAVLCSIRPQVFEPTPDKQHALSSPARPRLTVLFALFRRHSERNRPPAIGFLFQHCFFDHCDVGRHHDHHLTSRYFIVGFASLNPTVTVSRPLPKGRSSPQSTQSRIGNSVYSVSSVGNILIRECHKIIAVPNILLTILVFGF